MTRLFLALLTLSLSLTALGCGGSGEEEFRAPAHAEETTDDLHEEAGADE